MPFSSRLPYYWPVNPLAGVVNDTWRLYRDHPLRLTLTAAALFIPARGLSAAIYGSGGFYGVSGGGWSDLLELFAALLLLIVVARTVSPGDASADHSGPSSRDRPSPLASFLPPAASAAILAAAFAGAWSLYPLAGHFAVLIRLPALYLAFMGLAMLPAAVIERSGPLRAWRRSWQLIRGNEWRLLGTMAQLWLVNLLIMLVPILVASYPGLPYPQRHLTLWAAEDIAYGPFLALAVTLIYHRLSGSAAHQARDGHLPGLQSAEPTGS